MTPSSSKRVGRRNLQLLVEERQAALRADQEGSPRPKKVSWTRRASDLMCDPSDSDEGTQCKPFTITSLHRACNAASTSEQAIANVRESLDKSNSLTPTKVW